METLDHVFFYTLQDYLDAGTLASLACTSKAIKRKVRDVRHLCKKCKDSGYICVKKEHIQYEILNSGRRRPRRFRTLACINDKSAHFWTAYESTMNNLFNQFRTE